MKYFKGLLRDSLPRMRADELEKAELELFTVRLHLESAQGRERTLMARIDRLRREQVELHKEGEGG